VRVLTDVAFSFPRVPCEDGTTALGLRAHPSGGDGARRTKSSSSWLGWRRLQEKGNPDHGCSPGGYSPSVARRREGCTYTILPCETDAMSETMSETMRDSFTFRRTQSGG